MTARTSLKDSRSIALKAAKINKFTFTENIKSKVIGRHLGSHTPHVATCRQHIVWFVLIDSQTFLDRLPFNSAKGSQDKQIHFNVEH